MAGKKTAAKTQARKKATKNTRRKAGGKAKTPLLPAEWIRFFKNIAWRFLGGGLVTLSVVLLMSFLTYNPADPTYNRITGTPATNILGPLGANVADIFLQTIALVSYLLPLPLMVWGAKIMRLKWLPLFWLNMAAIPFSLLLLSVAASTISPSPDYSIQAGYGGALGQVLFGHVNNLFDFIVVPYWGYLALFLFLGSACLCILSCP